MGHKVIPAKSSTVRNSPEASCSDCRFHAPPNPGSEWEVATPGFCLAKAGKPIDLTIMTREEVETSHKYHAKSCDKFNSPRPYSKPKATAIPIAISVPQTEEPDPADVIARNACTSCDKCVHYVGYEAIKDIGFEPNWYTCTKRGDLLDPTKMESTARACEYRKAGYFSKDFDVQVVGDQWKFLKLFPDYDIERIRAFGKSDESDGSGSLPSGYDPDTFSTNVSEVEEKQGLKGWVEITDPDGSGNSTVLPVFRSDFFSADERAKIPVTGSDEHPESYFDHAGMVYAIAVAWMEFDDTPVLEGPPGTGKTELARHIAWIMQIPFERISITNTTELHHLEGDMRFENNETIFKPGRVVTSWQKPNILLIDEPNVGPRDVWHFLRPLTDNSKQLVVDANDGVPIAQDPYCFMMLAMNPAWDMKNDGANDLADADIRRLLHLDMPYPERAIEKQIILSHLKDDGIVLPDDLVEQVLTIGEALRKMEALPISWGVGQQVKVAKYLRWWTPTQAYNRAAGNYLEPSMRELFLTEV